MNRISVVAVTLSTAAAASVAATAAIMPAMAAARPAAARPAAARSAAGARSLARTTSAVGRSRLAAGQPALPGLSTADIAAESDGGKYVTVVHCAGTNTPDPIRVGAPGTPLTASGTGSSAGLFKMLQKPNPYKTVYTCTVTVEVKVPPPVAARKTAPRETPKKPHCELSTSGGTASGGTGGGGTAGGTAGGGTAGGAGGSGHGAAACTKSVTLNTGFGGMAAKVAHHRPAS